MKKLIVIALALLLVQSVSAIRIEEVYYDPIKTESGGEAIVLYSEEAQDISFWTIKTESSPKDISFPNGTIVDGFFLVTDDGWSEKKDNVSWNDADYEEPMTLNNANSGIELIDNQGIVVDAVGWGEPSEIYHSMYKENPANHTPSGMSLLRKYNTDDNSKDFISSTPFLKSSRKTEKNEQLKVNFEVVLNSPRIVSQTLTDDFGIEGYQIIPNPGGKREIELELFVENQAGFDDVTLFIEEIEVLINEINETYGSGKYKREISFDTEPKEYTLEVELNDKISEITYEVMPLLAVTFDSGELNVSIKEEGKHRILGDTDMSSSQPTIKNIGNVPVDLGVKSFGGDDIKDVLYSFDNNFDSPLSGKLSDTFTYFNVGLQPSETNELGLEIVVPETTGKYSSNIILSGRKS